MIYIILDQSSDEMYFRLGVFLTFLDAYEAVLDAFSKSPDQLLYDHHYDFDEYELINILEVEEGMGQEIGRLVAEFKRERYHDEEKDEFLLKITKDMTHHSENTFAEDVYEGLQ